MHCPVRAHIPAAPASRSFAGETEVFSSTTLGVQSAYYCNITGDPRLAPGAFFPLTVQVPVGLTSTVIFANISGPIPGTEAGSNVVNSFLTQQPGLHIQLAKINFHQSL